MSIDTEAKRISLSYRETLDNPWKKMTEKVGSIVDVKINNITEKAIFADLDNGLTGMLHYREISFDEAEQNLKKFSKGQKIKVKIIEIKDDKIRFSIRRWKKILLIGSRTIRKKKGQ